MFQSRVFANVPFLSFPDITMNVAQREHDGFVEENVSGAEQVEMLIGLVRNKLYLYDPPHRSYKDLILAKNTWEAIAKQAIFKDVNKRDCLNSLNIASLILCWLIINW